MRRSRVVRVYDEALGRCKFKLMRGFGLPSYRKRDNSLWKSVSCKRDRVAKWLILFSGWMRMVCGPDGKEFGVTGEVAGTIPDEEEEKHDNETYDRIKRRNKKASDE